MNEDVRGARSCPRLSPLPHQKLCQLVQASYSTGTARPASQACHPMHLASTIRAAARMALCACPTAASSHRQAALLPTCRPHLPYPPLPHVYAAPWSSTAIVCWWPHATRITVQPAKVRMALGVGCGSKAIWIEAAGTKWKAEGTGCGPGTPGHEARASCAGPRRLPSVHSGHRRRPALTLLGVVGMV